MHGGLQDSNHTIPYCASYIWFEGRDKDIEETYYTPTTQSIQVIDYTYLLKICYNKYLQRA